MWDSIHRLKIIAGLSVNSQETFHEMDSNVDGMSYIITAVCHSI